MKKGFRTVLLLSACLVLLAGCASEPKTQYNVNTQGAANTQASANPSTNTAGSSLPADYDPASEEDDYTGDAASTPEEIHLPTLVTPPPTNTPIPVISGQYSGATPVVIDPIDKPTPTPLPALSFTYQTYTASNLNLTFEGPAGWVVDTSEANSYKLQSPDWATGYAATLDGGALTARDPTGIQAEKAVRRALAMADLTPGDIDFVSAHGTGTGLNDAMEAGLLARVFPGKDGPAVTAFKSWTGHLASACGAVETALAIICAQERITPPVRGLRHPLTDSLRFVLPGTAPAPDVFKPGSCGLVENFGFGGQNAALCLRVEA